MDASPGFHVVLAGLMGTGKSTIGEQLARSLGREYLDNDEQLETHTGRTARQIADEDGFDALHVFELEVLRESLSREQPAVIGAAASVVDTDEGRALLHEPFVVFLRADPSALAQRLIDKPKAHRPLGDDAARQIREQAARRYPHLEALADLTVDALSDRDQLAQWLAGELSRRKSG
jgi:shikimate kinase